MLSLLLEKRFVVIRGKRIKVATFRLLLEKHLQLAFQGDHKSMKFFLDTTDNFKRVAYEEERAADEEQQMESMREIMKIPDKYLR